MARFGFAEQYFDNAGDPLSGGKLYFYETGTTTPKTTYSDEGETTPNTNPVVLDAAGRMGDVFFSGDAKLVITDSDDVTLETVDPVTGDPLSASEIKTSYESNANTNAYTDAEKTKLAGIEAAADVTDETNVIASLDGASIPSITATTSDKVVLQDASDLDSLGVDSIANILALATFDWTPSALANGEYFGTTFTETTTTGLIAANGSVRRNSTGVSNTANTTEDTATSIGIVTKTSSPSISESVTVLTYGVMKNTSWSWTPGDQIYSGVNGALTTSKYSTTGQYNVRVGIAIASNAILVNPQEPVVVP